MPERFPLRWLLAACAVLAACGGEPEGPAQFSGPIGGATGTELAADQTIRLGNGAEPQTLDPHRAEGVSSSNILRDLFEGLTIEAPDGTVIPGVAESWAVSADSLTYTFKLRDSARWSNGDPVTADDFVYGLRRSVDPATLSNYSTILEPIRNAMAIIRGEMPAEKLGVEARSPHELVIELNGPTPYFPGLLNHASAYPVHRASLEKHGSRFARPGNLVSNGAYKLDEWIVQSHVKLLRNEYYRDNDNTTIDTVFYYPLENQDTELKRYRANELDVTYEIPNRQADWVRENFPDELIVSPYLSTYYYSYNVTREPFRDNVNLRRALALAIDREIITEKVTNLGELPAYSWVPPIDGYEQAIAEWAAWTQAERDAEARRLYAAAGYSADKPLKVKLHYNTSANHKRTASAIAAMWKMALGVETELINQEWKVFLTLRTQREETEVMRDGWVGDYNDPFTFSQLFYSENDMNHPGYASEPYDALIEAAAAEMNLERRAELLRQAEQILLEDMPIIPIYFYVSKHLIKPWVGGWQPNIMDHHYTKDLYILKH